MIHAVSLGSVVFFVALFIFSLSVLWWTRDFPVDHDEDNTRTDFD